MFKTIEPEWWNTELINILRWADDGGKITENSHAGLGSEMEKKNQ